MSTDLNTQLGNLEYSFAGLALAAERAAAERREHSDNPYAPSAEEKDAEAKYWRRHQETVKAGFVLYGDPPKGCSFPQVAVPGYHDIVTEAIKQSRIRYASQSDDPTDLTRMDRPRPDAAPPKPIPTSPFPGPTAGARQTPSPPAPTRERGKGDFSKGERKVLKRLIRDNS